MTATVSAAAIKAELKKLSNAKKREASMWFFKTEKGAYGAHDQFIGVTVPEQRKVARAVYKNTSLKTIEQLLKSPIHEHRLTALIIMTLQYGKADKTLQTKLYKLYLRSTAHINNWDLVDTSAPRIVGEYLREYGDWKKLLPKLARSKNLWEKRIAIVATLAFSYHGDITPVQTIAPLLFNDTHDLIHKATGWMIREIGVYKGKPALEAFLKKHYKTMPRTALRYSIEHLPVKRRKQYLAGLV